MEASSAATSNGRQVPSKSEIFVSLKIRRQRWRTGSTPVTGTRRVVQKRCTPEKPRKFLGFSALRGGKKLQGFSVDANPPFSRSRGSRTHTTPILEEFRDRILTEPSRFFNIQPKSLWADFSRQGVFGGRGRHCMNSSRPPFQQCC